MITGAVNSKSITGAVNSKSSLKGKINNATEYIYPTLENLEVTPSKQEQIFNHPASDGYDEIKVKAIVGDELNVSPTIQKQEFNGLYEKVNVNGVTNEIDTNIIPENIKNGVEILGVVGNLVGGKYKPRYISFYNYNGTELTEELNNLDTSNITNMKNMFYNCQQLKTLDLSNFNTSNVTDMSYMFYYSLRLTSLDLSSFNTSNVTNMSGMFSNIWLTSINLSSFDTSNVTNMSGMFNNTDLVTLDLSHFNTSKVTRMDSMFYSNDYLTSLDLSSFDTSKVTNMSQMFDDCRKLKNLDIRNFTFDKVTSYSNMFKNVPTDCLIIVKDESAKEWVLNKRSDFTNIKTVAEL